MNLRLLRASDPLMPRMATPAISFGILIAFCFIYLFDADLYERILTVVSIHPYPLPFADWEMQPSSADCWQKGVNVYLSNTCSTYEPGGQHVYSPLWLRFTFLSADPFWVNVCGLGLAVTYIGSLALFPSQRRKSDLACFLLTAVSSATILVIERGNVDLLIYDMVVVALLLDRTGWVGRSIAYVLFACGGLLKFYPVILLALAVREKLTRFLVVAAASSLTFVWFWWCYARRNQAGAVPHRRRRPLLQQFHRRAHPSTRFRGRAVPGTA